MAQKPMAMCMGEVVSTHPLKISVDQKMTLTTAQLILTNSVRDFSIDMTADFTTDPALGEVSTAHKHSYSIAFTEENVLIGETETAGGVNLSHVHNCGGKKSYKVHLGLNIGEKVILLRCDGGQRFIVLDRVEVS